MKAAIVSRGLPDSINLMNGIFELNQAKALAAAGADMNLLVADLRSIIRLIVPANTELKRKHHGVVYKSYL